MEREKDRRERAIAAAVAAGAIDPRAAWPEFFAHPGGDQDAFPSAGADMSGFTWENPTEERAKQELETLMRGARVTLPDPAAHPAAGYSAPPAQPPPPREPPAPLRPGAGSRFSPDDTRSIAEWG